MILRRHNLRTLLPFLLFGLIATSLILFPEAAQAAANAGPGGTGLPWEAPLIKLQNSLQGPVARAVSMLGLIACGAMLVFGAELNEFVRRVIMLVLVISLLVFSNQIVSTLFNNGATFEGF